MSVIDHAKRIARQEAARASSTTSALSRADRLARARSKAYEPRHTRAELEQHAKRDDVAGRVAAGLLRLGEGYWLAAAPERALPELDAEQTFIDVMGTLSLNPERFADFMGFALRKWQRALLRGIAAELDAGSLVGFGEAIRRAVSSGHGVGKSMLVAVLILWGLYTFEDARIVVTASTEAQVTGKTWPELAKWHRQTLFADWFVFTATSLYSSDKRHEKTWRADAVAWNESRPESFAGLHNQGKRIVLIFDEASAIADGIYVVGENALTDADTQMVWLTAGNPTRATGYFYECLLGKFSARWRPIFVDRREVEGVSQAETQGVIDAYGIDSNYVRVRVRGLPPLTDDLAFFSRADVELAMRQPVIDCGPGYPMIIGVDVARRGGDASVLVFRQELDARSFPPVKLYGLDLMALAARIAAEANKLRSLGQEVAIMCDGTGLGAGVVDRLRQLGYEVIDVQFASKPPDPQMYANLRAFMHGELRAWLRKGGALPNDARLLAQMAAIEYSNTPTGQILLERKDDLRNRLGHSPDELDALCCTFAAEVAVELDQYVGPRRAHASPMGGHDPYVMNEEHRTRPKVQPLPQRGYNPLTDEPTVTWRKL